jgi:hypothetical protein
MKMQYGASLNTEAMILLQNSYDRFVDMLLRTILWPAVPFPTLKVSDDGVYISENYWVFGSGPTLSEMRLQLTEKISMT